MSGFVLKSALIVLAAALSFAVYAQPKPPADKAPKTEKGAQSSGPATNKAKIPTENFQAQCVGCHGIPGYKTAFPDVYHVPKIAGQQPAYIVNALKAYKSGERSHPSMRGIAASLTEEDMKALAEYYGGSK